MSRPAPDARSWLCAAAAAAGLAVVLAGCGSSQLAEHASPTRPTAAAAPAPADAEPAMVMITLTDRGYRASDVDVALGQPVMFMVVNRGAHPHELRADVPVSSLEVDDPSAPPGPQAAANRVGPLDVTIAAGHEIDVTFVPSRGGRYAMSDGQVPAGAIVVG